MDQLSHKLGTAVGPNDTKPTIEIDESILIFLYKNKLKYFITIIEIKICVFLGMKAREINFSDNYFIKILI